MDIRQVIGGYIIVELEEEGVTRRVFVALEGVFTYMLFKFEGRKSKGLPGDKFGEVMINRTYSPTLKKSISHSGLGANIDGQ